MKKVLWISRHHLTGEQMTGLEAVCGGDFALRWWQDNVEDVAELGKAVAEADVVAAVLPLELLAELVAMAAPRPVVIAKAKRVLVPTEEGEPLVRFTHDGWQQVKRLELKLEPAESAGLPLLST